MHLNSGYAARLAIETLGVKWKREVSARHN
jgi:hypothetical protein